MSVPGKDEGGYAFLDVLVALLIIMIGFGALFGALRTAGEHSVRFEKSLLSGLDERNGKADDFGL